MLASQPVTSPLGILLVILALILVVRSPKKLQTLLSAVMAAAVTMGVIFAAVVLLGFPEVWLKIGGLLAELLAVIAAWWHVRSVKRAEAASSASPAA